MIDFPSLSFILVSISIVIAAVAVYLFYAKGKIPSYIMKKGSFKECELLFQALKECHFNNTGEYLSKIKLLAQNYPDEPVFFLFAGDIARRTDPQKALEIHRDILFRPTTTGKFRALVLKHVAEDYAALKQNTKALSVLKDAVKHTNFPQARLKMSKLLELEGRFEEAYDELEKYVSGSELKEALLLKRFAARATHFCFTGGLERKSLQWLDIIAKFSDDQNEIKAVDYFTALIKGKEKKAGAYLTALTETSEEHELLGRSLLIKNENGFRINSFADGRLKETFDLFFHPEKKIMDSEIAADKKSVFLGHILSNSSNDPATAEFLKSTMTAGLFFICSECGSDIKVISPVCRNCQKITGRKFKILSED